MKHGLIPEFLDRFAWTRWAWYRRWGMRRAHEAGLRASDAAINASWEAAHRNCFPGQVAKNERFLRKAERDR